MPLITPANAREMALRSAAARRLRREREERAKLNPPAAPQCPSLEASELYVARRLAKVRDQLDRVDAMFDACRDPIGLDRIAAVLARLSELERQLANRPLPGSRRPRSEPARKLMGAPSPID